MGNVLYGGTFTTTNPEFEHEYDQDLDYFPRRDPREREPRRSNRNQPPRCQQYVEEPLAYERDPLRAQYYGDNLMDDTTFDFESTQEARRGSLDTDYAYMEPVDNDAFPRRTSVFSYLVSKIRRNKRIDAPPTTGETVLDPYGPQLDFYADDHRMEEFLNLPQMHRYKPSQKLPYLSSRNELTRQFSKSPAVAFNNVPQRVERLPWVGSVAQAPGQKQQAKGGYPSRGPAVPPKNVYPPRRFVEDY